MGNCRCLQTAPRLISCFPAGHFSFLCSFSIFVRTQGRHLWHSFDNINDLTRYLPSLQVRLQNQGNKNEYFYSNQNSCRFKVWFNKLVSRSQLQHYSLRKNIMGPSLIRTLFNTCGVHAPGKDVTYEKNVQPVRKIVTVYVIFFKSDTPWSTNSGEKKMTMPNLETGLL